MKTIAQNSTFKIGGDLEVKRLGFGALKTTGNGGYGHPDDKGEVINLLKKTKGLGINFIDTADSYGPYISEELIAEALHPYNLQTVVATKVGYERPNGSWVINNNPKRMRQALEGSLKRLKVEQIDLYQLHRVDTAIPLSEQIEFLAEAQKEGLIKHIGLSEVSLQQLQEAMTYAPIASVQNQYSYGNRKWEDVLEFTAEHSIAFLPWYPLDSGNIYGKQKLETIAKKYGFTSHQIALAWLLHHSHNIVVIPGTSNPKHLEENVVAGSIPLTQEDLDFLN
ncbi:aldo/keto reductase [Aquimarina sp. D1M17]|uniref:aldo/keto reductase n=1 Tax=Aquimarina acroporae TaxID=2937283 RepID=UPI0020BF7E07|nr:aldo/keto reductase [Aquimarina acroporae]MCK8521284.1 aldo/keto reductase [Aquimarina acroporae]